MALSLDLLRRIQGQSPRIAWSAIAENAWGHCAGILDHDTAVSVVTKRDRELAAIDLYLATAGWDLWGEFVDSVPRTSNELSDWWGAQPEGKAVLILDALSLRELPWLLQGAHEHGFTVHQAKYTGAELPADTTPFAKALGFSQRSTLANNGAGSSHRLPGAVTDCVNVPWADCIGLIGSQKNWVLWHQWPDDRLHYLDEAGKGLDALTNEVSERLSHESFWKLVDRLTTGRRLVITADHGYAATGHFPDTSNQDHSDYLKNLFKGGRWVPDDGSAGSWMIPPLDLALDTDHGKNRFVLGRRKWKAQGGYPTLAHGGLTVLEVLVPFVEFSRFQGV